MIWDGGEASTSFGGTDITYDPPSLTITGGTVNSIVEAHDGVVTYAIQDIAVSALALFEAAQTPSTADDAALIRAALSGADTFVLSSGDDRARGYDGDDTLKGHGGNDTLVGDAGHDVLDGGAGTDRLEGGTGNDTYVLATSGDTVVEAVGGGTDEVKAAVAVTLATNVENLVLTGSGAINGKGNTLANRLTGNAAANTLLGLDGSDTLDGGSGADVLTGGRGADVLTGGTGSDDFVFNAAAESGLGTQRDTIKSFAKGWDDIALSAIDANTTKSGNQAFTLDAGGVFSAGEIRQIQSGSNLLIEMNTDGDTAAEMSILLNNVTGPLGANDFLL